MSWIITKGGFVSLVEHADNPNMLRARARRADHLANTFGLDPVEIIDLGPHAPDYRWHADIDRAAAAEAIARAVMDIDYTSHVKESISGKDNVMYRAMLSCWNALYTLQREEKPQPERAWANPWRAEKKQKKWRLVQITDGARTRTVVVRTVSVNDAARRAVQMVADAWKVNPSMLSEVTQYIISAAEAHQMVDEMQVLS